MNYKDKINELIKLANEKKQIAHDDFEEFFNPEDDYYEEAKQELNMQGYDIVDSEEFDQAEDEINVEDIDPNMEEMVEVEEEEIDVENFDSLPSSVRVDDPVRMYLKEIGRIQLLSFEQETAYAKIIIDGVQAEERKNDFNVIISDEEMDELDRRIAKAAEAKNKLVEANLRLVVSIAKKYMNRGLQLLDLIQEGNMGLMKAVDKFDYEKGFKFSTYATWWIRQAITRAVADQARTIRIPVHMVETINKLVRIQRQLVQEFSREPTPEEVAEKMGISVEKVQQIQKIAQEPISLEAPVGEEEDSSLGDFISDTSSLDPYQYTEKDMLHRELMDALSQLTDREEQVLKMRFGLDDGRAHTLEEVGKKFNVTRERIRQIEAKALRKLKHPSRSKKLRDFLNK